jgi:hypothetical protein
LEVRHPDNSGFSPASSLLCGWPRRGLLVRQILAAPDVFLVVEKSPVLGVCQEYILDNKPPDTRFVQCLQGFRVIKKVATMACTNSAPCAKMARMSTLCRAERKLRNVLGARPSRSLCGASRAAHPVKDVFGGTPNTARETHALPIHLSALLDLIPIALMEIHLKCAVHGLGITFGYSLWAGFSGQARSKWIKLNQSESK